MTFDQWAESVAASPLFWLGIVLLIVAGIGAHFYPPDAE